VKLDRYLELREKLADMGYGGEIEWAQTVQAPEAAEELWCEYAWVVLNSGMRNQIAEHIWHKVRPVVEGGGSAHEVFGHELKSDAIDLGWEKRQERFEQFDRVYRTFAVTDPTVIVSWCRELPWIGKVTCWHLAKNLGVDCAKPDRWLARVAIAAEESVEQLCQRLADESGDRVATVDLVIWRACNLGLVAA
jgi:hypothetical protein